MSAFLHRAFDRLARTEIYAARRRWHAFQVCGYAGLSASLLLAFALARRRDLSPSLIAALAAVGVVTFFAVAIVTKLITGEERLTYYHHEIAITASVWITAAVLRRPALPYLDVTMLAVGTFLAFGRIGCLMVGCCHGRPSAWGIRYSHEHAAEGFPRPLVGVRLFPIQAVESFWVIFTVITGAVLISPSAPGDAFSWYVTLYGAGRFLFEFLRGDAERPYWLGLSQPQWISMLSMAAVSVAELVGGLPRHDWHVALTAALIACAAAVALRRRDRTSRLLHPGHVSEIASLIDSLSAPQAFPCAVYLACTSEGICISSGAMPAEGAVLRHYSISDCARTMTSETASALAAVIASLDGACAKPRVVSFSQSVYHVLLPLEPAAK